MTDRTPEQIIEDWRQIAEPMSRTAKATAASVASRRRQANERLANQLREQGYVVSHRSESHVNWIVTGDGNCVNLETGVIIKSLDFGTDPTGQHSTFALYLVSPGSDGNCVRLGTNFWYSVNEAQRAGIELVKSSGGKLLPVPRVG